MIKEMIQGTTAGIEATREPEEGKLHDMIAGSLENRYPPGMQFFARSFSQRAAGKARNDKILAGMDIASAPRDQRRCLDLIIDSGADPDSPEGRTALKKLKKLQKVVAGGR